MKGSLQTWRSRPEALALLLALGLLALNVVVRPSFGSAGSIPASLAAFAPFAIAAMASAPSVISGGGGIDISIGPLVNLVTIVVVVTLFGHGVTHPLAVIPIALALGLLVGVVNGLLVSVVRYQPVIATLCGYFILTGVGLQIAPSPSSATTSWMNHLADTFGPVPGAVFLIGPPLVLWWLLGRAGYVKRLRAVGGDDATAYANGVGVTAVRVTAYALGGLVAGFGGIASAALLQSGDAGLAGQYTLPAIAAVVIGGTSLLGGRGGLAGPLAGAACIFLVQTLLSSLYVSDSWLQVAYGSMLIGAVIFSGRVPQLRRSNA
ncbi:ABC transporter permease [Aeromicrobium ginsengisoli]|uniref:ABC transporter permease n=1 Tax=Aeromicrobium ginsengisoli TaxID=363867 RepID=A0A5M4FE09_9ACTN|nr:ABC transporter permease [Aeromicrobium ginsengisoli]KAA1397113.1 ABC transporter permease [Aeromicrobium ginsengisoli]